MAYLPPTFNLECFVWRNTEDWTTDPPAEIFDCQLRYPGSKLTGQDQYAEWCPYWALLLPKESDIRDFNCPSGQDYVEVPSGSGRLYGVMLVDDVAKGFTNEYRIAYISKTWGAQWPEPIP